MWKLSGPVLALMLCLAAPAMNAAALPRKAAELSALKADGNPLTLSAYKGKVIVIAFILTTCSHCQEYSALLGKMQTEYAARGLQVVEVAVDDRAKSLIPGFVRTFQPPFPVGYTEFVLACDFLEHSRTAVLHVPAVAFISREGMVVAQYESGDPFMEVNAESNLRATVDTLVNGDTLKKAAPAKKSPAAAKKK